MRAYFLSFPHELEEAALLDGCSRFGAFIRVVVPVSRGAIASMAIINISWIWSELFFALVLLDQPQVRTLPLAVAGYRPVSMAAESVVGQQFAIMTLTALPLFVFYFLFQRQIRKRHDCWRVALTRHTDWRRDKLMSKWFGQTFRKVHKLYVSPQWALDQGASL